MGTDIHYKFQKKVDDDWVEVDLETDEWGEYEKPYYIGRSYLLFAVLAGVRNGVGFAGVPTHEPVVPISEPRGLPEGVRSSGWDFEGGGDFEFYGEHSQSWLLSSEILKYFENDFRVKYQGVIPVEDYFDLEEGEEPESYCAACFGNGITEFDARESRLPMSESHKYTHVRVQWVTSINEKLGYFRDMIQALQDTFGEVRMVFGFDS